jgi:hypothetical protein
VRRRATDRNPSVHEPELACVLANLSLCRQDDGDFDGAVAVARESVALTRRLAESDWPTYHALIARRLRVLGRALRRSGDHAMAVACYEESESVLEDVAGGPEAAPHASALAAARSGLALSLDGAARAPAHDERRDLAGRVAAEHPVRTRVPRTSSIPSSARSRPAPSRPARLDCTGPWLTFFAFTVPMSKPAFASAAVLGMPTPSPGLPVHGLVHTPECH